MRHGIRWSVAFLVGLLGGLWLNGAQAAGLGQLKTTSYLGEPFVAEAPLLLDAGEKLEDVRVDIADPVDYRILEVYRDPVVDRLQVEVVDDQRGARVRITSQGAIDSPFFNLVLKLVANNITQFKKYAVFLDPPPALAAIPEKKQASVAAKPKEAVQPAPVQAVPAAAAPAKAPKKARGFVPFDGWARIGRYGPIVYGDTLSTVARRLRIDDRYTLNQVMVALFRKNPHAFGENNINILKAGVYLDVPLASEVEAISPDEADRIVRAHHAKWEVLKQTDPRYARLAEAQRTRYSKRVRVGRTALGAPAPVAPAAKPAKGEQKPGKEVQQKGKQAPAPSAQSGQIAALREELSQLRQMNESLQQQLAERDRRIEEMEKKLAQREAAPAGELEAELAATKEQLKRLRIRLARMQAELERVRKEKAQAAEQSLLRPVDYALGGLVVVLLGVIGWLISRRKPEPIGEMPSLEGETEKAGAEEQVREVEVEEVPAAVTAASELELGEEDTSEMEPFVSGEEEEALDPNVDYLAEADVYLRYGLEDEAEKQVRNALKLHPDDPKAWAKLAQIQRMRGDEAGLNETMTLVQQKLADDTLKTFHQLLEETPEATGVPEEAKEEKTMILSPEEAETLISGEETGAEEEATAGSQPSESELDFDLGELEPGEEEEEQTEEGAEETAKEEAAEAGLDFDLGQLGEIEEQASAEGEQADNSADEKTVITKAPEETSAEAAASEASEEGTVKFDLAGLDVVGEESSDTTVPAAQEQAEAPSGDGELGLDLEGLLAEETKESEAKEEIGLGEEEIALEFGEDDSESTREISQEELGHVQAEAAGHEAEERAAELDVALDLGGEDQIELEAEEEKPAEEGGPKGEGELDLADEIEGLDLDELAEAARELDEFTSTLSGLETMKEDKASQEAEMAQEKENEPVSEPSGEIALNFDDVESATQELDDLLSELELDTSQDEEKDKGNQAG